jgi:hypothetical protein
MELNAEHEFWTMIEELATGKGGIRERAVYTNKRLCLLEPKHVPEMLRPEFEEIKKLAADALRISKDEDAQHLASRIVSFYGKLQVAGGAFTARS